MARRGWTRSIFAAVLAAAGSATAQLGLAYGLGVVAWAPPGADAATARGAWWAGLAWATLIAATSVVIGAVVGDRYGGRGSNGTFVRVGRRVVMALAATIGGLVAVPLVAIPARHAEVVDNYAPQMLAGVFAAAGVVLGLVVALIGLVARAVAANVFLTAAWVWVLGVVVVVDAAAAGRELGYAHPAVWTFTDGGPVWRSVNVPAALLMLGAALLIGGLAAFPAAGRADGRVGVALSGAFGPLIVAIAYLLAAPTAGEAPPELMSAYYIAPFSLVAGVAGSLLVAMVGGVPARGTRDEHEDREAAGLDGGPNGASGPDGAVAMRPFMSPASFPDR